MPVPSELTESAIEGARPVTARLDDANVIKARPNKPWFYVFYPDHPGNWFVGIIEPGDGVPDEDAGTWWLPLLQQESIQAGLNNHKLLRKGRPASSVYDTAHTLIRNDGGIVLPQTLGYLREVDCIDPTTQTPGVRHIDVWSTPRRVAIRGQRLKFDFDRQRYYRWLLNLMRNGDLPLPDPVILEPRRAQFATATDRIVKTSGYAPGVKEDLLAEASARQESANAAKVVDPDEATGRVKTPRGRKPNAV